MRPGGTVAFHEIVLYGESPTWPSVPLVTEVWDAMMAAFASVLPHRDVASRLVEHVPPGGIGAAASLFSETPVGGGPDSPIYAWLVQTLRGLQPQIERIGQAVPADIDTLEDRLRERRRPRTAGWWGRPSSAPWARVPGRDRLSDCE